MRGGNIIHHSSVDNSEHHGTYSFTTKGTSIIDGTTTHSRIGSAKAGANRLVRQWKLPLYYFLLFFIFSLFRL